MKTVEENGNHQVTWSQPPSECQYKVRVGNDEWIPANFASGMHIFDERLLALCKAYRIDLVAVNSIDRMGTIATHDYTPGL